MKTYGRRLVATAVAAAVAALGVAVAGVGAAGAESNGGVRVMPLGDSIADGTQLPGGYRIGLWQRFGAGGYRVDLVGSQFNGPGGLGDHDHEGHPGWRIDQIDANITGWLQTYQPRTVLLHIGTNDIAQNRDLPGAPGRLSALIDRITATAPNADVFVAQIIPLANASLENAVRAFNAAIPGIVQNKLNEGKRVHLVDMHSALTTADLIDGVHPNAGGYEKMAATWYSALLRVPGSIGEPDRPTPTPTVTTPPPGGQGCTAAYSIVNQWPDGFQATVRVTAGSSRITAWTVTWRYAGGQTITQAWNATVTASGAAITARNMSYNGTLAAGGTTEFGFTGTKASGNETPTVACAAA